MILFSCSHCSSMLQVTEALAGKKIRCPGCDSLMPVPQDFAANLTIPLAVEQRRAAPPSAADTATMPPREMSRAVIAENNGEERAPDEVPQAVRRVAIPGYEILEELGRGGMGVVYKARQTRLKRLVALKMILVGGHASQDHLIRFRTEAEAVARLQHANIVQVYEIGEHEGLPFFSLELCAGGSLEQKLDGTPWLPNDAARLVETLAGAMHTAHAAGVIHRDLKPANVLLTADGTPKVTDFGLAKKLDESSQTRTEAVVGTPSYMAPEQTGGRLREIGPASDVYALGAVLYELLTGRPPFRAATAVDTILQVASEEPVSVHRLQPLVPRDLETVCHKCLQKEPRRRYASARELAEDLQRFRKGEPVQARPVGRWERAWKWVYRNPALAAALAAVALALLLGTVIATTFAIEAHREGREAKRQHQLADQERQEEKKLRHEEEQLRKEEEQLRREEERLRREAEEAVARERARAEKAEHLLYLAKKQLAQRAGK